jgi:Fe-S-cluster-containing dehydrogenase component
MDQCDVDVTKGAPALRSVVELEKDGEYSFVALSCMHCDDSPCIMACPVGCLRKDPETNLTIFDNENCIGCHSCSLACPYGAPSFSEEGKMIKCDGCIERLRHGLQPACVKTCPTEALKLKKL